MSAIRHGLAHVPWMFALACGSDGQSQGLASDDGAARAANEETSADASIEADDAQDTSADASRAQEASPTAASDARSDADQADPCRVACRPSGNCGALLPTFAPTLEETLAEWTEQYCSGARAVVYEERCADGKRTLRLNGGSYSELRYFDAAGHFLGLTGGTDAPADAVRACPEGTYWPAKIACIDPELVRFHCAPPP